MVFCIDSIQWFDYNGSKRQAPNRRNTSQNCHRHRRKVTRNNKVGATATSDRQNIIAVARTVVKFNVYRVHKIKNRNVPWYFLCCLWRMFRMAGRCAAPSQRYNWECAEPISSIRQRNQLIKLHCKKNHIDSFEWKCRIFHAWLPSKTVLFSIRTV